MIKKMMIDTNIHPSHKPQIADLIVEKALTNLSTMYVNFADIFSLILKSSIMLLSYLMVNNHFIGLSIDKS